MNLGTTLVTVETPTVRVVEAFEPIFTPRHHVTPEQETVIRLIAEVFPGTKVELDGIWRPIKP